MYAGVNKQIRYVSMQSLKKSTNNFSSKNNKTA